VFQNGYGIGINANNQGTGGPSHVSHARPATVIHSGPGSGIQARGTTASGPPSTQLGSPFPPASEIFGWLAYGTINSRDDPIRPTVSSDPAGRKFWQDTIPITPNTTNDNVPRQIVLDRRLCLDPGAAGPETDGHNASSTTGTGDYQDHRRGLERTINGGGALWDRCVSVYGPAAT